MGYSFVVKCVLFVCFEKKYLFDVGCNLRCENLAVLKEPLSQLKTLNVLILSGEFASYV